MKTQIRIGTFETNSSSVHSLAIVSENKFNDWKNGKIKFNIYKEDFLNNEDANKYNINYLKQYEDINILDIDNDDLKLDILSDYVEYLYLSFDEYDNIISSTYAESRIEHCKEENVSAVAISTYIVD